MKITQNMLPILNTLRVGGLNRNVRGWDRLLRGLFPLASQTDGLLSITYRGFPYAAATNHYVDWEVLTTGAYEYHDLAIFGVIAKHLRSGTVLDIGTNVGHHAFSFASLGWRVLAFEPNPDMWPIILAKLRMANFENVELHKVGLSDEDAVLLFNIPDQMNSGTGQFHRNEEPERPGDIRLPVRRGDTYLSALGVTKIDVIKMDIQGFEQRALSGLRETMTLNRPIVCVEIGDENRASIPSLVSLEALLPENYVFMCVCYKKLMLFRFSQFRTLGGAEFAYFDGNLFCIPKEKVPWFAKRRRHGL
jgi:FkbM family methyltransferase